jgi:hypothetical protein
MFERKLQKSVLIFLGIFISAISMQAQAWSFGVSWYSEIDFTLSAKGNKLKLANGNFVVSELYAFNYVSTCIKTQTSKLTIHSGLGNNGGGVVIAELLEESSDGRGKDKGTFFATGTQSLGDMIQHYALYNPEGQACYSGIREEDKDGDGVLDGVLAVKDRAGNLRVDDNGNPVMTIWDEPTGDCTEDDRNPRHSEHFCLAEADQKVEHKDDLYLPAVAMYVRIVEGNEDGTAPVEPYIVKAHGIAECIYTGTVTPVEGGGFDTTTKFDECDVTEYPLSVEDPRFDHVLSF